MEQLKSKCPRCGYQEGDKLAFYKLPKEKNELYHKLRKGMKREVFGKEALILISRMRNTEMKVLKRAFDIYYEHRNDKNFFYLLAIIASVEREYEEEKERSKL